MSAVGTVTLTRRYEECLPCRLPQHVADEPFGLEGRYSVGLRRLAVRAGTTESFASAAESLKEYCSLEVSLFAGSGLILSEGSKLRTISEVGQFAQNG